MIRVEGMEEAQAFLQKLKVKVSSDATWQRPLGGFGLQLERYASSISPVVTGSYAGAHRATVDGKTLELSIDPGARNSVSGVPVIRYAGPVEERHQVYARTGEYALRMAVDVLENVIKELGL